MASKLYMLVMSVVLIGLLTKTAHCGTHLDRPWFDWAGGRVPYYFNVSFKYLEILSLCSSVLGVRHQR